jgi:hypothetical protein
MFNLIRTSNSKPSRRIVNITLLSREKIIKNKRRFVEEIYLKEYSDGDSFIEKEVWSYDGGTPYYEKIVA